MNTAFDLKEGRRPGGGSFRGDAMMDSPRQLTGRIAIVINPVSGGRRRSTIARLAERLQGPGRSVEIVESAASGHIHDIARTIDAEAILVAGGDGAVNEAVTGLLQRPRPRPVLGVIPQGTANILGYELGLPAGADPLAAVFLQNHTEELYVGLANDRPFVCMASAGFDAEVVKSVNLLLKRRIGAAAYLFAAARLVFRYDKDVEVRTERESFSAKLVVVTNAARYGGDFVIDPAASVYRRGLTLVAVTDIRFLSLCKTGLALIRGRLDQASNLRMMPVGRVELSSRSEIATQVDGDVLGSLPMTVREGDEAIEALVPASRTAAGYDPGLRIQVNGWWRRAAGRDSLGPSRRLFGAA